jgi:hypothetical protein
MRDDLHGRRRSAPGGGPGLNRTNALFFRPELSLPPGILRTGSSFGRGSVAEGDAPRDPEDLRRPLLAGAKSVRGFRRRGREAPTPARVPVDPHIPGAHGAGRPDPVAAFPAGGTSRAAADRPPGRMFSGAICLRSGAAERAPTG